MSRRQVEVSRTTAESTVSVKLSLDGGQSQVSTGIGFFDHLLASLARHARIGLVIEARGDLHVDSHHTVEDIGLTIGEALDKALGERAGVVRFGFAYAPLDEALARAVIDLSGRPYARVALPAELIRSFVTPEFPITLVGEFWRAVASRARLTLHLDLERATDPHHAAEACCKAVALALRQAVCVDGEGVPSTKGTLVK